MEEVPVRSLLRMIGTLVVALLVTSPAAALTLSGELPRAAQLVGIQGGTAFDALANAIADTAARNIPVLSASAGFTYRYDPGLEAFVRTSETLGPLFLERPDTIGRGKFNINVSYQYVELNEIDGVGTNALQSPDQIVLAHTDASGAPLPATANTLRYSFKLINNVEALSFTYGVLDNLDVNLLVPLIETNFDVTAYNTQQAVKSGGTFVPAPLPVQTGTVRGNNVGIGDILLRGKYQLPRWGVLRSAAGLQLRLPSGDEDNLQGTGSFEASPAVYVSALFWGRVEPHWNAAIDLKADDVSQSQARYGAGVDVDVTRRINIALALLGRSEFARSSPAGATSFLHRTPTGVAPEPLLGIDFNRKDYFDFSFGARAVGWRQVMLFVNGIYAINDSGLRNDSIIPTIGFEGTF